jgi:hypothetical protein
VVVEHPTKIVSVDHTGNYDKGAWGSSDKPTFPISDFRSRQELCLDAVSENPHGDLTTGKLVDTIGNFINHDLAIFTLDENPVLIITDKVVFISTLGVVRRTS